MPDRVRPVTVENFAEGFGDRSREGDYRAFFADRGSRAYMACHELGHTIGLRHWGNPPISDGPARPTCMQPDVPNGPTDLHRWDIEDINMYYALPATSL